MSQRSPARRRVGVVGQYKLRFLGVQRTDGLGRPAAASRMNTEVHNVPTLAFSRNRQAKDLREASDRELLAVLSGGDELALDELIRRKMAVLVQVAHRVLGDFEEARDVVQLAFVRIWENRDRYDEKWSPNTWIYRITTNLAIDHLRSQKSRERVAEPLRLHIEQRRQPHRVRAAERLGEREVEGIFEELAADLTEKQRAIFVLRELEGLSSSEVAEIVGCRESTVRNHLFNARKTLRAELIRRYPEYAPLAASSIGPSSESSGPGSSPEASPRS